MSSAIPWASAAGAISRASSAHPNAINRVLDSGNYILGAEVESFESAFAEYCGGKHAVGVGSGTDALILALKALGIGPGDDVITVSHTAVATVAAILASGATPVLIDVDEAFLTLDPAALAAAVTPRSKAVIAVHLYGQPADLEAVIAVAKRHGLAVIEDCAQAAGGHHRGRRLGSIGDIGCFSFYPTKNLGAIGDGGMVVTSRSKNRRAACGGCANTAGMTLGKRTRPGFNSRLDPLQAAILQAKLPHLDADNAKRASDRASVPAGALRDCRSRLPKNAIALNTSIIFMSSVARRATH